MLAPLVYMNMYCTVDEAIYMTMLSNNILGMGAMLITILVAFLFILIIQYPLENFFDKTLRKYIKFHN